MGLLAKQLLNTRSAYDTKKNSPTLWDDLKDRIEGAMLMQQLDEVVSWLDLNTHLYPPGWRENFDELIDLQRDVLAAEDISQIVRDRYDFT
jgi:hypothetical protein